MNSVVYDVTVVGVLLVAPASLPGDCFRGTAEAVNKGRASSQLAREHPSRRISPRDRIAKSSSATGLPSIFPSFPQPLPPPRVWDEIERQLCKTIHDTSATTGYVVSSLRSVCEEIAQVLCPDSTVSRFPRGNKMEEGEQSRYWFVSIRNSYLCVRFGWTFGFDVRRIVSLY